MYDCLTLIDATGTTRVDINRNGSIHGPEGLTWPDWLERCDNDMEGLITEIGRACLDRMAEAERPVRNMFQHAADTVAGALRDGGRVLPVWDPIDYVDDPINRDAIDAYREFVDELIREWQTLDSPTRGGSPLAWVWAIELDGEPSRLINLATGELWRTDGSILGLTWTEGERSSPPRSPWSSDASAVSQSRCLLDGLRQAAASAKCGAADRCR